MDKEYFHKRYRKVLRGVAAQLGLAPSDCRISSCKGGPAVMGEVILHSDRVYIMVMPDRIMYRSCVGRQDYVGGVNRWIGAECLETDDGLQRALRCFRDAADASGKEANYG